MDELLDQKIEKRITETIRKLKKRRTEANSKDQGLDRSFTKPEIAQQRTSQTNQGQQIPQTRNMGTYSKRAKSGLGAGISKNDMVIPQGKKMDTLIDKVQEFQDLAVQISEGYLGDIGEFSKDLNQRKMNNQTIEYLQLDPGIRVTLMI